MSDDSLDNAARSEEWDPLTSPTWEVSDDIDVALAPDVEEFMPIKEDTMIRRKPLLPPDADEIIRGEYTGWVPLIKSGETLAQAKAREEKLALYLNPVAEESISLSDFDAPKDLDSDSVSETRDPIIEIRPYDFPTEIVADPDFVVSPAQALEDARLRIAQMRASLQTNISRVSQSFDHPIFNEPVDKEVQEMGPGVLLVTPPTIEPQIEPPSFESLFETQSTPDHELQVTAIPVQTQVRGEPRTYTQSTSQTTPTVIIDEAADQTHSLELVIMRDEIKDLRDRLDSSQKLIENLMIRLADLAELALKRRD
jgi:hypothetical protein